MVVGGGRTGWTSHSGPFGGGQRLHRQGVDLLAHSIAQGLIDPLVALDAAGALEFGRHDGGEEVPPVALDVREGGGLEFALGIGEAPVGLQGTFSTWASGAALTDFAYRRSPHQAVIDQTHRLDWYSEELFARFALLEARGTHQGRPVAGPPAQ